MLLGPMLLGIELPQGPRSVCVLNFELPLYWAPYLSSGEGVESDPKQVRLHGKGNSKLPWRKAGQPRHLVDVVDSDQ